MPNRPLVLTAATCLVVGAVGGYAATTLSDDDDPPPFRAALTQIHQAEDVGYRFTDWWTDGRIALQLIPREDGLTLANPFGPDGTGDPSHVETVDLDVEDVEPSALAALPGEAGAGWAAIGMPDDDDRPDDEIARAVVWTGDADSAEAGARGPAELPVDIVAQRSDGGTPYADVAVASTGGADDPGTDDAVGGLAYVSQSLGVGEAREEKASGLLWCSDLDDCEWEGTPVPAGGGSAVVGSTGYGYVLALQDDGTTQLWFSPAEELDWQKIGDPVTDRDLVLVQDGAARATLVWRHHGDDPRELSVQTIDRSGELSEAERGTAPDPGYIQTVMQTEDAWLVGTATRSGTSDFEMAYDAERPMLLRLGDGEDEWAEVRDPVLTRQPDQSVVAIVPGDSEARSEDALRMATTSAVQRTTMLWRLIPREE